MIDKIKRKAQKVLENQGSVPLAHLEMMMEMTDKLDEVAKQMKEQKSLSIPGVKMIEIKGDKGDKGDPGTNGVEGETGPAGARGPAGPQGPKGEKGEPGKDGHDGRDGRDGVDGNDGKDGDDAQEIDIEKLLQDVLEEVMKRLPPPRVIERGGGFIETPIKQGSGIRVTKDGSGAWVITATNTGGSSGTFVDNEVVAGATNTFTLANVPIAGAEHVYAQGQRLTPGGVDYTISGAVITTINSWSAGDILADYQK